MAGPKFCYNVGELQLRGAIQYPVKMAISWPFIICFKHIQWVIIVLTAEEKISIVLYIMFIEPSGAIQGSHTVMYSVFINTN